MRILLLGGNGQVGWELRRSLAPLGEVVAPVRESAELCGDLEDTAGIVRTVGEVGPDVIVNAAAYTAVDRAEAEPERAHRINAETPGAIARASAACGALLVHYSTDYVFDGSGTRPWSEDDEPRPLNAYGRSKLAGELEIAASGCRHWIFRTSWVFATRGRNFAKTILRLAGEREELKVVADQVGAPTGADLLADVTALALQQFSRDARKSGLFHVAAAGETSWHGYAEFVCRSSRIAGHELRAKSVQPVPSSAYPAPALRPANSRLNTTRFTRTFGLVLPDWSAGVSRMLDEVLARS